MQIEEGKYYKTRDGRKVGPAKSEDRKYRGQDAFSVPGIHPSIHLADGTYTGHDPDMDIVAEWPTGPVVTETVTKTRIVPGTYGNLTVDTTEAGIYVRMGLVRELMTADELDAAAAVLSALAKGLRDA